jgi:hypothetical protein
MLGLLVAIATTIWVYRDAKSIGMGEGESGKGRDFLDMAPGAWAICCFMGWFFVLPLYLARRYHFISQKNKRKN